MMSEISLLSVKPLPFEHHRLEKLVDTLDRCRTQVSGKNKRPIFISGNLCTTSELNSWDGGGSTNRVRQAVSDKVAVNESG